MRDSEVGTAGQGSGLVLKHHLDTNVVALGAGEDGATVARERRLHFARYLATRTLSIDVWDADSLLQLGTVAVELQVGQFCTGKISPMSIFFSRV